MKKVLDQFKAYGPVPIPKLTPANARNESAIQRAYLEVLDQSGADIFPKTQIFHRAIPAPKVRKSWCVFSNPRTPETSRCRW